MVSSLTDPTWAYCRPVAAAHARRAESQWQPLAATQATSRYRIHAEVVLVTQTVGTTPPPGGPGHTHTTSAEPRQKSAVASPLSEGGAGPPPGPPPPARLFPRVRRAFQQIDRRGRRPPGTGGIRHPSGHEGWGPRRGRSGKGGPRTTAVTISNRDLRLLKVIPPSRILNLSSCWQISCDRLKRLSTILSKLGQPPGPDL